MPFHPSVLIVGDPAPPEFGPPLSWLADHARLTWRTPESGARGAEAAGPVRAAAEETPADDPHLIVFLQNRPGQITEAEVAELHARWPLAPLVVLLGSWCEGEPRTGRPLPGVCRVEWHRWEAEFAWYWVTQGAGPHPWRLPRTHTPAERFLQAGAGEACGAEHRGRSLIALAASDPANFAALAEACRAAGYLVARWHGGAEGEIRGAAVAVWDEPGEGRDDHRQLADCARHRGDIPLIALQSMLRWEDWLAARAAGATTVLAKPLRLTDLLWHLDQYSSRPKDA